MPEKDSEAEVQFQLGESYLDKDEDAKGLDCLRKAAEMGHINAMIWLGEYYYYAWSKVLDKDTAKATEFFHKAEAKLAKIPVESYLEHAREMIELGNCYAYGAVDGNENKKEADKWYRKAMNTWHKAAEGGDDDAMYWIGVAYFNGEGAEQDYTEAANWFYKAARKGHVKAQFELGKCYYSGMGVDQSEYEAAQWFQAAAAQGHEDAQEYLYDCNVNEEEYEEGDEDD